MDRNTPRRMEKCPSGNQSRLENRGSVLEGGLHPPRENMDELLELLSSLSEDLPSSLISPVTEEGSRNAHGSLSILRQGNVFSQVQLASLKSGHAFPPRKVKSNRAARTETTRAKPRTVRFSDLDRYPASPSRPCYPVDGETLDVWMDYEELEGGGCRLMKNECDSPASTAQPLGRKAPEKSQSVLIRDPEFDAPFPELLGEEEACCYGDWTDPQRVDYTGNLCGDEAESVSELNSVLESSWTSASLHRSMLDLEISEQLLMFELGPLSPKAEGDFSHLDPLEPVTEDGADMSASHNANTLCSLFQCQRGETSCHAGKLNSKAATPAASKGSQVISPLHRSGTVINDRMASQLVRPHSARTLDSSRVPMALSQNESGYGSQNQAGGTVDTTFSVRRTASDQSIHKQSSTRKALFQHGFSSGETSTEGRFSKDRVKLSHESLILEECHFGKDESCSYSHPTRCRTTSPLLAVYPKTGSNEVPHFLLAKERATTKENLFEVTHELTKGQVRHSQPLMYPRDCGDGPTTFVESSLGRQKGRTSEDQALRGSFSHLDKCGLSHPPAAVFACKESACRDSDGTPGDKREEVEPRGMGWTTDHQFWKLPDSAEVWRSSSVVTVGQRFLAHCRLRRLFQTWSHRQRCQTVARRQHRNRVLKRGLSALKWAVAMRHMQADAMATRRRAALLSRCFGRVSNSEGMSVCVTPAQLEAVLTQTSLWKACLEQKRALVVSPSPLKVCLEQKRALVVSPSPDSDVDVEALRRRLIQPSESLLLRVAYCAWRKHFQGLHLLKAAHLHHHLTLLFKHWLEWRRRKVTREARAQLERRTELQYDGRLKGQALLTWRAAWDNMHRAQSHHRASCLAAVWRRWAKHVRGVRERLQLKSRSQSFHRRALLQPSLSLWRARAELHRSARDRQNSIARMAVQRWKSTVKRRRLDRLQCKAVHLLAKRTLSAAFGKWCQAKSSAALERTQVWEGRHLLARRRLQAAFTHWQRGSGLSRAAWALLERGQKARLICCLRAWISVVHQRSAWLRCSCRLGLLSAGLCLQRWRRALDLRRRHRAFISAAFQRRRQRPRGTRAELRGGVKLWGESEPVALPQWKPSSSEDLQIHQAFRTWVDSTRNLQLARLYHVTKELERVRAVLKDWHTLAQLVLDAQVHSFCTRLAQLDSDACLGPDSTPPACLFLEPSVRVQQVVTEAERGGVGEQQRSGGSFPGCLSGCTPLPHWQIEQGRPLVASPPLRTHTDGELEGHEERARSHGIFQIPDQSFPARGGSRRLKSLLVGAVGRIKLGSVAVAFFQWRALVRMSRGQRALLRSVGEVRTRSILGCVFRAWRTGMENQTAAHRHRERCLLASCVTQWSRAVCLQRLTAILQRKAQHLRTNSLLIRCFSTWRERSRVKLVFCEREDAALLESRVGWLLRRAEKRRIHGGFALWAARVRQNLAVRRYCRWTLLARVFVAWKQWTWLDQGRRLMFLQWRRGRMCRAALGLWRVRLQQQQEIRRRRANGLALQARDILHRWHSYVQSKNRLRQLLYEHTERKRRMTKRTALRSWVEEAERTRTADVLAQTSLQTRCLQQWCSRAVCEARARRAVAALERERTLRTLRAAFSLWAERRRVAERRLMGRARAAARRWRERALRSRAESHRAGQLTSRALVRWRRARTRRGEGRRRAREIAREWLRRARRSRSRQEGALDYRRRCLRTGLALSFARWAAAYHSTAASDAFHAQRLGRRALLTWRGVTVAAMAGRRAVVCLQARRQERLTASSFSRWQAALQLAQSRLRLLEHSVSQRNQRATMAAMQHWKTATRGRLMLRNVNQSRLQKAFGCWRQQMEAVEAADALCVERGRRGARGLLAVWLRWAKESKARRQMGEAVWLWVRGRRVSSTFYLWVRVLRLNKEASQLVCTRLLRSCVGDWQLAVRTGRQAVRAAEKRVSNLQLHASFSTWRKRTLSQQDLHIHTQLANARQERRLLSASFRAWHRQVEARKCRSLHLFKMYLSLWVQRVHTKHCRKEREGEESVKSRLSQKYLRRWRQRILEQRFVRRRINLLWTSWKDQAAAAVFFKRMCAHRLRERAWMTWRKRRIRARVSTAFADSQSRTLLAQAFGVWRDRAL